MQGAHPGPTAAAEEGGRGWRPRKEGTPTLLADHGPASLTPYLPAILSPEDPPCIWASKLRRVLTQLGRRLAAT